MKCTLKVFDGILGCYASKFSVTSRNEVVTTVNDQSSKDFDGSEVKLLWIHDCTLMFVPEGMGKFFPKLQSLKIWGSKLEKVTKKDLAQFPLITEVSICHNELKFLPGDLFEANPELTFVDFSRNKIRRISSGFLEPLTELQRVHLHSNLCINKVANNQLEITETIKNFEENCSEEGFEDLMKQLIIDKLLKTLKATEKIGKNLKKRSEVR
jgi:hypothetical protein